MSTQTFPGRMASVKLVEPSLELDFVRDPGLEFVAKTLEKIIERL
jgi:hypothetical protein